MSTPTIRRVCINKSNHNKTFRLMVEINEALLKGLVDTGALMSIMVANVVREFNIVHLVSGHETYKIASGTIIQALGRITNIPIMIGKVVCQMIFLVVNTNSYDLLLGLIFSRKSKLWLMWKERLYKFKTNQ